MLVNGWHLSISSKKEKEKERDEKIKADTNNTYSFNSSSSQRTLERVLLCKTLLYLIVHVVSTRANGFEKESKCQLSK